MKYFLVKTQNNIYLGTKEQVPKSIAKNDGLMEGVMKFKKFYN